ncbi:MAG: SsrA-binding protein [Candidatus Marinimicrobia bacterium]|nr:SsrA-binding protein [Candidatus Neomarinimicrobiota bacterium]
MNKVLISHGSVAQNRKARRDYVIEDTMEAGIILTGSEVKSLRNGRCTIVEAFAQPENGEIYLINAHIPAYEGASHFQHEERRKRKLLLHKKEVDRVMSAVGRKGMTLVPLSVYFNNRGIAKVQLGLAKGKTHIDRREDIKNREWQREQARVLRAKG